MVLVFAGESHKDDEITRLCAELAAVTAERDDFAEQLALRSESGMAKDMQEIMRINNELVAERDALAARLAPVDDDALVETVARAICLNRASHACNCKEDGACKAPLENLREYNEVWPQARAAIAAAIRSRGSE